MIETPKTMLDWFAENHISYISVKVDYKERSSLATVQACIELDEATGRGKHTFAAWDDEGDTWNQDYGDEISAVDARVFAEKVQRLTEVLGKPYPSNDLSA